MEYNYPTEEQKGAIKKLTHNVLILLLSHMPGASIELLCSDIDSVDGIGLSMSKSTINGNPSFIFEIVKKSKKHG